MNDKRMFGILPAEGLGGGVGAAPNPSWNELAMSEDVCIPVRSGRFAVGVTCICGP